MIEIGCLANFNFTYRSEIEFAVKNNFKIVQIWYDKNGLSLPKDQNPINTILRINFPAIIHAVLDINEFEEHVPKILEILRELGHSELIIHPVCKSDDYSNSTIQKLSQKVQFTHEILSEFDIQLYVENNSKLDPLLNTPEEVSLLFNENPAVKFILDIAHIQDYEHLDLLVKAKFPEMLHVADKHFHIIHEHLPIGEGELDFKDIFSNSLKGFNGKIILEVIQSKDDIIRSRDKLVEALSNPILFDT